MAAFLTLLKKPAPVLGGAGQGGIQMIHSLTVWSCVDLGRGGFRGQGCLWADGTASYGVKIESLSVCRSIRFKPVSLLKEKRVVSSTEPARTSPVDAGLFHCACAWHSCFRAPVIGGYLPGFSYVPTAAHRTGRLTAYSKPC